MDTTSIDDIINDINVDNIFKFQKLIKSKVNHRCKKLTNVVDLELMREYNEKADTDNDTR
jgi:hypothetical protein